MIETIIVTEEMITDICKANMWLWIYMLNDKTIKLQIINN